MVNITPFELIPYLLGKAGSVSEARELLSEINLVNINFADELPLSPIHWMMSDNDGDAIVIEPMEDGLKIFDNPAGVLTNNPTFDKQLFSLNNYRSLSNKNPENTFSKTFDLDEYSRGMGGIGLPGDLSSASRFAKVAFTRENSYSQSDEISSVGQFFHILGSVEQQNGCTFIDDPDLYEYTIYTSCYSTNKAILYYRTYKNSQITAVDLNKEDLDSTELINYLLINEEQINFIN